MKKPKERKKGKTGNWEKRGEKITRKERKEENYERTKRM
jgi:hypothetical protein